MEHSCLVGDSLPVENVAKFVYTTPCRMPFVCGQSRNSHESNSDDPVNHRLDEQIIRPDSVQKYGKESLIQVVLIF
ncbi:hypothetical protein QYF36_019251 [Acer negundo]|nr:hypothetical protein QYF36_019251 [Acer negundo]